MLETDHLVTRRARAKAREPLLVTLADLLLRYRRRHNPRRGVAFRVWRPDIGRRARLLSLGALSSFTITALSLRGNAFPQSDDLWAQSFAAKFMLETDHFVTRRTRAKAREPLLVTLADLLLRYRRRHNPRRCVTFRVLRPGIGRRVRLLSLGALSSSTIIALSLRRNAFPQSDDLWAQS